MLLGHIADPEPPFPLIVEGLQRCYKLKGEM
jgi:hypothetical protein